MFDVVLNGEHIIVESLDIFARVGRGAAHDELIPFTVRKGKLHIAGDTSTILDGEIPVEFVKVTMPFYKEII